jgi:hypothetical protein
MSKQKDLMTVFNFLAEYLREEETTTVIEPVDVNPKTEEVKPIEQSDLQILGVPSRDILELIKKVESIDKQKAEVNSIIKEHDRSFTKELKRIKEEHEELVKNFELKVASEDSPLPQSGSTITDSIAFVTE